MEPPSLQARMGLGDVKTTMRYVHPYQRHSAEVMDALDGLLAARGAVR